MKFLEISNTGELDIRLVELMGGTTKRGDKFKIGKFGTGLKYTLSFLVRQKIPFKIYIGEKLVDITTKEENISGTTFHIIYIDGQRSSLTTSMGEDWEAWMIIRELWCNAIDEGGEKKKIVKETSGVQGRTSFFISLTDEIEEINHNWNNYFIHDLTPLQDEPQFAIYKNLGSKGLSIYKNGVLIHEIETKKPAMFMYDIKNATINELREYTGVAWIDMASVLGQLNKTNAEFFLKNVNKHHEETIDYDYTWSQFSDTWKDATEGQNLIDNESYDKLKEEGRITEENAGSFTPIPKSILKKLTTGEAFTSIRENAIEVLGMGNTFYPTNDKEAIGFFKECVNNLNKKGYHIEKNLRTKTGFFLKDETIMTFSNGELLITDKLHQRSETEVFENIVRHNESFKEGIQESREDLLATHFIKKFIFLISQNTAIVQEVDQ